MKSGLSKDVVLNWSHYVEWAATLSDLPALIHSDVNTLLDWKTVFAGSYVPLLTFILCRSLNFLNCILYYFRLISLSACIVCFFLAGGGADRQDFLFYLFIFCKIHLHKYIYTNVILYDARQVICKFIPMFKMRTCLHSTIYISSQIVHNDTTYSSNYYICTFDLTIILCCSLSPSTMRSL